MVLRWDVKSQAPPAALVSAMLADPTDRDAYLVYADWLSEQGDPQGELIATAVAAHAEPKKQRKLKMKATQLLAGFIESRCVSEFPQLAHRFRAYQLGDHERSPDKLSTSKVGMITWRWGVITSIGTWEWPAKWQAQTLALLASPLARFAQFIYLRGTPIVDLSPIGAMRSLQEMELIGCTELTDLSPIAGLLDLWKLELQRSAVVELGPLAANRALRYVNVERTKVRSLRALHALPKLWEVWCQETGVTEVEAEALRVAMARHPMPPKPPGGMDRRDVYGP